MATPVSIITLGSFSPLGSTPQKVWQTYKTKASCIKTVSLGGNEVPIAALPHYLTDEVEALRQSAIHYKNLDNSVLYAILAARNTLQAAGVQAGNTFGVNIGSSRGATGLFEGYFADFLKTGKTGVQASPATTLGNISSWVAQDLKTSGPDISHSITCSTAMHAVLNGIAWLNAGMADAFLVGGSEAPLTHFTIAQMQAMKIYSRQKNPFYCRALDFEKTENTMVLGEGASMALLKPGRVANAIAYIEGYGYATEILKHSVSISEEAICLQKSMEMALKDINLSEVDAVVMHAPGTIKGDTSEFAAIKNVFGAHKPLLTTNKWITGHTFGASGLLSLEFALLMLQHNEFIQSPFYPQQQHSSLKKILVNAVGFGGNAVSILVTKAI
ncbi:beta-ketoacyl synthase N-terminal-like domain-containing protein [Flavobacterium rhizosphaerae]|uniref:Beta-ketoacyl synthase N-terminal-like domain-containing protein n=1 Tax=Flavobacterium rhizosphaerae TaxID=3163298 RepID=A0ABW8YV40_9FLAO